MFEMMGTIREIKGGRKDDEDALMAMFMGIANGPPADDDTNDSDVSEEWGDDDDDDDLDEIDETGLTRRNR